MGKDRIDEASQEQQIVRTDYAARTAYLMFSALCEQLNAEVVRKIQEGSEKRKPLNNPVDNIKV